MTQVADHAEPGLRERKKRATRRALQRAALELVAEHGLDEVTVEQIAAAAEVSPRTFFNYFASKEDALAATDPEALDETVAAILARPPSESPLVALREVSLAKAAVMEMDTEFWRLRAQVIKVYPELGARLIGASIAADFQVAEAIATRMGVDPRTDPRPMLLASSANAAKRTAIGLWMARRQEIDLVAMIGTCFDELGRLAQA